MRGILMLLIALASLVGGVFLIFMGTDEQQNHMNENTHSADELEPGASRSNASRRRAQDHENEAFIGKLAIIAFTLLGTAFFLVVQCAWFKKFYDKLARVNREIKIDAKKQRLSTICKKIIFYRLKTVFSVEESSSLPSSWNSRDSVVFKT